MVDGQQYVVVNVVSTVLDATTETYTQTIQLAGQESIDLDTVSVSPGSTHTLSRLAVADFSSTAVSQSTTGDLEINVAGLSDGDIVNYLGPNSEIEFVVAQAETRRTAARSAMGKYTLPSATKISVPQAATGGSQPLKIMIT